MIDLRQSDVFSRFMTDLGWQIDSIGGQYVFLRKFPLVGYFAKMPRIQPPFPFTGISEFRKKFKIFRLKISPFVLDSDRNYQKYRRQFRDKNYKMENSPFNPTTNFHIDLTKKEDDIFQNFTEAKRRGVRRALKNGVLIKESDDLDVFIRIRSKQYFPLGFLISIEMKKLWKNFYPKNASLLLAHNYGNKPVAGIILLFYNRYAYYWYASALKEGKRLFAPTLLVWEALKLAKRKGCKIFDFEGIYDERFPKASESWKGFTKFKEGFGGKKVVYMENFYI